MQDDQKLREYLQDLSGQLGQPTKKLFQNARGGRKYIQGQQPSILHLPIKPGMNLPDFR